MDPNIPYQKLSKRKKKEQAAKRRGSWGTVNPVTRKSENPKAYNRRKARKGKEDADTVLYLFASGVVSILSKEQCDPRSYSHLTQEAHSDNLFYITPLFN